MLIETMHQPAPPAPEGAGMRFMSSRRSFNFTLLSKPEGNGGASAFATVATPPGGEGVPGPTSGLAGTNDAATKQAASFASAWGSVGAGTPTLMGRRGSMGSLPYLHHQHQHQHQHHPAQFTSWPTIGPAYTFVPIQQEGWPPMGVARVSPEMHPYGACAYPMPTHVAAQGSPAWHATQQRAQRANSYGFYTTGTMESDSVGYITPTLQTQVYPPEMLYEAPHAPAPVAAEVRAPPGSRAAGPPNAAAQADPTLAAFESRVQSPGDAPAACSWSISRDTHALSHSASGSATARVPRTPERAGSPSLPDSPRRRMRALGPTNAGANANTAHPLTSNNTGPNSMPPQEPVPPSQPPAGTLPRTSSTASSGGAGGGGGSDAAAMPPLAPPSAAPTPTAVFEASTFTPTQPCLAGGARGEAGGDADATPVFTYENSPVATSDARSGGEGAAVPPALEPSPSELLSPETLGKLLTSSTSPEGTPRHSPAAVAAEGESPARGMGAETDSPEAGDEGPQRSGCIVGASHSGTVSKAVSFAAPSWIDAGSVSASDHSASCSTSGSPRGSEPRSPFERSRHGSRRASLSENDPFKQSNILDTIFQQAHEEMSLDLVSSMSRVSGRLSRLVGVKEPVLRRDIFEDLEGTPDEQRKAALRLVAGHMEQLLAAYFSKYTCFRTELKEMSGRHLIMQLEDHQRAHLELAMYNRKKTHIAVERGLMAPLRCSVSAPDILDQRWVPHRTDLLSEMVTTEATSNMKSEMDLTERDESTQTGAGLLFYLLSNDDDECDLDVGENADVYDPTTFVLNPEAAARLVAAAAQPASLSGSAARVVVKPYGMAHLPARVADGGEEENMVDIPSLVPNGVVVEIDLEEGAGPIDLKDLTISGADIAHPRFGVSLRYVLGPRVRFVCYERVSNTVIIDLHVTEFQQDVVVETVRSEPGVDMKPSTVPTTLLGRLRAHTANMDRRGTLTDLI